MDIESTIKQSHLALEEFAKGNHEPFAELCSRGADVVLANPFGATAVGWDDVAEALAFAASQFRDGNLTGVDTLATCASDDVVTVFDLERWRARVGDRPEVASFELRVSTTWRREDGEWKVAQRHADPIRTFDAAGPLR